jgi:hypothetical protein
MSISAFCAVSLTLVLNSGPAFRPEFETWVQIFFLLFVYLLFLIGFNNLFSLFIMFNYFFLI